MEISIKKPCHENWDSFTPNEQGAFCGKCVKTVIDFSNKSIDEIEAYFTGKQAEKVCGRFETSQLTALSFDAFFNEFKGFTFTKRLAVILYFTFGMWLFNTSSGAAQTNIHEKGDVQVNPQTSIMGGIRAIQPADTTKTPCVKPRSEKNMVKGKVAYVKPEVVEPGPQKMGEVIATPPKKPVTKPKKPTPKK